MLKPKREEMGAYEFLILMLTFFFLIASAIRGGYLFIKDFLNFIF